MCRHKFRGDLQPFELTQTIPPIIVHLYHFPAGFPLLLSLLSLSFPPFYFPHSFTLSLLGTSNSDDMPEELSTTSRYNIINRAKTYMVWFLRTHGFYGVLIMASYPNIAFDLCGIACGHFLMPFWTFFGATFLGKAVVRNGYQSIIYVMLCR